MSEVDAVVVGSGPNGLAAAVTLARAGLSVLVFERASTVGGGLRTAELTLPGFLHDVCSAVQPLALASGFFTKFQLERRMEFAVPSASYATALDGGRAGVAYRDLDRTVEELGVDGPAWRRLLGPLVERVDAVAQFTGSPLLRIPRHPLAAALVALRAFEQGTPLWNLRFETEVARSLLTGVMAHATLTLPSLAAAGEGLVLATHAHARGWPIPVGGSQAIADALADDLRAHGGEIVTDAHITSLGELPSSRAVLLDTSPQGLLDLAAGDLPASYVRRLSAFRYGNAVAKVDFALSDPVPWANPALRDAGTLHLGGTRRAIAAAERAVARGRHSEDPYVLVAQPSVFDASRAPAGRHTLWAYTHVPRGSTQDETASIVSQIERFAPGFRDTILASASRSAVELEAYNPNYVGGDIASGAATVRQLVARPVLSADPWRTPAPGLYLCSASTPPGPGVHGLAGWYAARSALRNEFGITRMPSLGRD